MGKDWILSKVILTNAIESRKISKRHIDWKGRNKSVTNADGLIVYIENLKECTKQFPRKSVFRTTGSQINTQNYTFLYPGNVKLKT